MDQNDRRPAAGLTVGDTVTVESQVAKPEFGVLFGDALSVAPPRADAAQRRRGGWGRRSADAQARQRTLSGLALKRAGSIAPPQPSQTP